jgi:hypothetical protein
MSLAAVVAVDRITCRWFGTGRAIVSLMPWRLSDATLTSAEAAAVLAVLCQHCARHGVATLPPLQPDELSITVDGDLRLDRSRHAPELPSMGVLQQLHASLLPLVVAPAPALVLLAVSVDGRPAFSDPAAIAGWLQRAFALTDSRAVLRPIAERMTQAPSGASAVPELPPQTTSGGPPPAPAVPPARRRTALGFAMAAVGAAGVAALLFVERSPARQLSVGTSNPRPDATVPDGPPPRSTPTAPEPGGRPGATGQVESRREAPKAGSAMPDTGPARVMARAVPLDTPGVVEPVFSPSFDEDGTAMFFHIGRDQPARLVEARLDDQYQLVQIKALTAGGGRNYHARLSPNGRDVAFDSDRDGERGVYIGQRDGSAVRRVSGSGFAAIPTWSPDGARLAFVRAEPDRPHVWNLWIMDVASGRLQRMTGHRHGQLWGASWFPDGRRVAFSHEDSLSILDLTSGQRSSHRSPIAGRLVRTPAVSPEGERIVFQVQGDGVWLLDLDGSPMRRISSPMRRILDDPSAEEFTWDPRGARVAYHSRRDGQWRIWITTPPAPSHRRPPPAPREE